MKKKLIATYLTLLCLGFSASADIKNPPCVEKPLKFNLGKSANKAFSAGEKFTYIIKYEFINAGQATLEVHEGPLIHCRPTYQLVSHARSTGFVDNFFVVRDYNCSTIDKESLFSFGMHQNLREGKYRVIRTTTMDYSSATYTYVREKKGTIHKREGSFAKPVNDILSAFFRARTLPLELGTEYDIRVFSDENTYDLKVKVFPQFEDVTVPAGKFECIKIEPKVMGDAIFKARDGGMLIWLTSDERRIPVLIRSKVAIGSFDAELRQIDTPSIDMVNEKVPSVLPHQ